MKVRRTIEYDGPKEWVERTLAKSVSKDNPLDWMGPGKVIREIWRYTVEKDEPDTTAGMTDEQVCQAERDELDAMRAAMDGLIYGLPLREAQDMVRGLVGVVLGPSPYAHVSYMQTVEAIREDGIGRISERPYLLAAIDFIDQLDMAAAQAGGPIAHAANRQNKADMKEFFQTVVNTLMESTKDAPAAQEGQSAGPDCSTLTAEDLADTE